MMSAFCRRTTLFSLFFIVLTTPASGQNDLDLVFRTMNDEYISFEEEDIAIVCSHSLSMQNIIISIYYDSGAMITTSSLRQVTATLPSVSNSPTVFCNVSGDVQESAQLTIKTISRDSSPYCVSGYTDGIIANTAIKLSCYIDTLVPAGLVDQWRDNNNMDLVLEERNNIFGNTRRISSTAVVGSTNNGTNYTCVEVRDGMTSASCQVGPIFVYENVFTFIEFPDMRNLSHGDTREFRCSSVPSSDITWTVLEPVNVAGIVVSINGPVINVTVLNNVSFVGIFRALCVGNLNGRQGVAPLDVYITPPITAQSSTASVVATTLSTTVSAQADGERFIIYIICGAVGGVVVILIIVLFIFCLYKRMKQKGYRGNTTQPVKPQIQENGEPEYADPPIGMTTLDDVIKNGEYPAETSDENGEPDHYETEGGLYTAVNKETKEQSRGDGAALVPPSSKAYPKSYTLVDKNDNGGFNLASDTDANVSLGDGSVNVAEPPPYAMVDKKRHIIIDEGFLDDDDDDNDIIEGDYSEYHILP